MTHFLDSIILFCLNPLGLLLSLCAIIYGEYLLFKSIRHDKFNKLAMRRLRRSIKRNLPIRFSPRYLQKKQRILRHPHRKQRITVVEV